MDTGELVILLLSDQQKWRFELLPGESDLRPVGLITQRLAKVVGVMTKKEGGL